MSYSIRYQKQAIEDAIKLKNEEPKAFLKLLKLEATYMVRGHQDSVLRHGAFVWQDVGVSY